MKFLSSKLVIKSFIMNHIVSVIYINKSPSEKHTFANDKHSLSLSNQPTLASSSSALTGYGNFNITEETLRGIMLLGYLIFGPNVDKHLIITHKGDILQLFILGEVLYSKLAKLKTPIKSTMVLTLGNKSIKHLIPITSNNFKRGLLQCAQWFNVAINITT